jgi:glycine/D-amino acid oxidase-like deaminating enzyme
VITRQGERIAADAVLIAAGAWSSPIAAMLGVDLPVRARKRDVFSLQASGPLPGCPLVIDPTGFWFRPDGDTGQFLCGSPPRGADLDDVPLDQVDHGLFDEWLWPRLAERVPQFDALRVTGSWAGYYEYNTFDQNGLVGRLPGTDNVFVAAGFSGHGLQQAPAVGSALAALIAGGTSTAPPLDEFHPRRVAEGRRIVERNII